MALHDFWGNVRSAFKERSAPHIIDAKELDAEAIERILRDNSGWLTRKIVSGYSEAEFAFLPDEKRRRLTNLVKAVGSIARQVPLIRPAMEEQIETAVPLVRDIIEILAFDHYGDPEAFRIGTQIEQLIETDGPTDLAELRFETHLDWAKEPGIWIWAILRNESGKIDDFLQAARGLQQLLWVASREIDPEKIPYISFRSISGQAKMAETMRA